MSPGWEKIFSSTHLQRVEMIKAILLQNEIQSVLVNKQDALHIGDIQLFVQRDDVLKAIQIINKSIGE
jgi:hypothetical protein